MRLIKNYRTKKGQYLIASNYEQNLFLVYREITGTYIIYQDEEEVLRFKKRELQRFLSSFNLLRQGKYNYLFDSNLDKILFTRDIWFIGDEDKILCNYNKNLYKINKKFELKKINVDVPKRVVLKNFKCFNYTAYEYDDYFLINKDEESILKIKIDSSFNGKQIYSGFSIKNNELFFCIEDFLNNRQIVKCG